jgi:integrase
MKGWVTVRETADGRKRYDATWRVGGRIKTKTYDRRKDADNYLVEIVKRVHDGTYREIEPLTFREYSTKWLAGLGLKPSTVRDYRSMLDSALLPAFGDRPLAAIGVDDVNAFIAQRRETWTPRTAQKYLVVLHKLFDDAVASDHLAVNRLHRNRTLVKPKALRPEDEHEITILDAGQINQLLDHVELHYVPLFTVMALSGMRLGEALALQFGDVDHVARQIKVRRSLYKGKHYLPKSKKSRRSIDVGDQALGAIRTIERARYGDQTAPAVAMIFTTPGGALIDPNHLRNRVWLPALAAAGLPHVTMHSLRHSYASLLIAQNENLLYVSAQLGHGSAQTTANIYAHLFPSTKREAPARLEAQLATGKVTALPLPSSSIHPANQAKTP